MTDVFPMTSRYHGVEIASITSATGRSLAYLRRRIIPPPEQFALLQEHRVVEGDRLDNLTAQYLGDPEQFWQICDANAAIRPQDLTAIVDRRLRITLPVGIPGVPYA